MDSSPNSFPCLCSTDVEFYFLEDTYFGTHVSEKALRWLLGTQQFLKDLNKYNISD